MSSVQVLRFSFLFGITAIQVGCGGERMRILVIGLNHKTAPVELRERLSISDLDLDEVLSQLRDTRTVMESVIVSTCNRLEVYALVSSVRAGEDFLRTFLARRAGLPVQELSSHLYVHQGIHAARHLFKVVSGLDSLVLGETQILGQVRSAFLTASDAGNTGALFNQLFRKAVQLGKRAQTETSIGQSAVSVSYAAVQLAKKIFGELMGRKVLVVGAGKMSQLTVQHLHANGIAKMMITNRTYDKAVELAAQFHAEPIEFDALSSALAEADIVIASTGARGFVITRSMMEAAAKTRGGPVVLIDIAVPRDIDPAVGTLPNLYLYDIDDLEGVVSANLAERERQAVLVDKLIEETLADYSKWLNEQEVVPLITALREKGTEIQASVMESLQRKLPDLTDREVQLIQKHTMSIVNQLLHDPIQNMKELAIASGGSKHVHWFAELFGIPEERLRSTQQGLLGESEPAADGPGVRLADIVRLWSDSLATDTDKGSVSHSGLHPVLW